MPRPTFRFAPSPNGDLHIGHALSARLNRDRARAHGGCFLIRIEDIDRTRAKPGLAERQLEDLAWLGIVADEPPLRQSARLALYGAALDRLIARRLVYRCAATRAEIAAAVAAAPDPRRDPEGAPVYPGLWRGRAVPEDGRPFAWRLDMAAAVAASGPLDWAEAGRGRIPADPSVWGDVVVARKDAPASYHLAVVVDDAAQGITHVVRGADLEAQTTIHRLLQTLLGLPEPELYEHHRLVMGPDGRKLSKSDGATSLRALRAAGATPDDVWRAIGY